MNCLSERLVSVVITTYNVEKYIEETLNSIFTQTYKNIEVIIIDDGSTDGTVDIISKFNSKNILLERKEHTGNIGKNLNDCIRISNGEIIAVMGADDIWYPEKTRMQISYLDSYKFVCSDKNIIDGYSKIVNGGDHLNRNEIDLCSLLFRNEILASSIIGYKTNFIECGLFDEEKGNRSEDYALWLRIAEKYSIKYVNVILVGYRIHGNNLSNRSFSDVSKVLDRNIELISRYLQHENVNVRKAARSGIAAIFNRIAIYKFYEYKYEEALAALKMSFKQYRGEFKSYYFKRLLFFILIKSKIAFKIKKIGFEKHFIKKW